MKAFYLKRYPFSHAIMAIIIVLSLAHIPEVPHLENISLMDKWTHMFMYGVLTSVIWWEYLRKHQYIYWQRVLIGAILLPILLGGSMELAQKYLTTYRSGEWLDVAANSIGVLLGTALALLVNRTYKAYRVNEIHEPHNL